MINENELKIIKAKLVDKAVDMADRPDFYDTYNKGWVAGQIKLLQDILEENCPRCGDPTDNITLCDECK